jgi:hypothetical protein
MVGIPTKSGQEGTGWFSSSPETMETGEIVHKGYQETMTSRIGLILAAICLTGPAFSEEPAWVGTLERISTGIVSIRVDSTRAFDTEWNSSTQATGFVVDAGRGRGYFS